MDCWSFGDAATPVRNYVSLVAVSGLVQILTSIPVCAELRVLSPQYCANDADCSNYHYGLPPSDACVVSTSTTLDQFHTWEGGPQSCTFPTGVTFNWDIPSSAHSQAAFSWVG